MDNARIRKSVAAELSNVALNKGTYCFLSQPDHYSLVSPVVLRFLTHTMNYSGVYVALNKPHCDTITHLENNRINTQKIFFIDTLEDKKSCKSTNRISLEKESLTALSLAISEACQQKQTDYLFLDSVTTLLIYERLETVQRFIHFISNKLKNLDILLIIMAIEEGKTRKLIPLLEQVCEKCIKL